MAFVHVQTIELGNSGTAISVRPTDNGGANYTTGSRVLIRLSFAQNPGDPFPTISSIQDQSAAAVTGAVELATCAKNSTTDGIQQRVVDVPSMPAGVTQIVVNLSGAPTFGTDVVVSEYTGCGTGAADVVNALLDQSYGTGANAVLSGTATNTAQPALLWACCEDTQGASAAVAGSGFTQRASFTRHCVEDARLTTTASQQATFTSGAGVSRRFMTAIVIIDEPGASGASTPGKPWQAQGAMGVMVAM